MSTNKAATKADLQELYSRILPYLGGSADAGFTPVGTVISVMGNHAPANYLKCDGTAYNIVDYPELADYFLAEFGQKNKFGGDGTTTFAVPDLRGEFLRGTGTNSHSKCGSGASVGTHQDPTGHLFDDEDGTNKCIGVMGIDGQSTVPSNIDSTLATGNVRAYVRAADQYSTSGTLRYSSRPTNTSVLYCIATKNIYMNPSLDYSTSEKVVGTWINGKPIYQITISLAALGSDETSVKQEVPISNLDKVIEWTGACESATVYRPLPYAYPGKVSGDITYLLTTVFLTYEQNKYYINSTSANYDFSNHEGYITLRYTKTTD